MSRRNVIVALCAAAVLLAGGGLYASNMGFKLNYSFLQAGTASGTNTLALPYNRQIGIDNAEQLLNDINTTGTPVGKAVNVQRYVSATDAVVLYSKAPTDPAPFLLETAIGYFVKVSANTSYIVVGSHNPAYQHTFLGIGPAATGRNFFATPYHSTRIDAAQLFDEINLTGSPTNQVANLQRYLVATDAVLLYSKAPTDGPAFPIVPGEAYFVKLSGASNVLYTPSHY
jgi:hypothetical protein